MDLKAERGTILKSVATVSEKEWHNKQWVSKNSVVHSKGCNKDKENELQQPITL